MTDTVEVRPDQLEVRPDQVQEIEVRPDQVAIAAFDDPNNKHLRTENGVEVYMAQPPAQRFGESLWRSTLGGAIEGAAKIGIGTDELGNIADLLKAGKHEEGALALGKYLLRETMGIGPAWRMGEQLVENTKDQFARGVEDFTKGNYGGVVNHAVGMVPIVGPMISQPIEQIRNGDYAGAGGTILGELAMLLGPKFLEGRSARVPIVPKVKNTLNPVEQASQTWMESKGIETPLSMQTGSKTAANLEGSVRNEIGGSSYALDKRAQTRADVMHEADQLLDQVSPGGPVTRLQAGEQVIGEFKSQIRTLDLQADQAYKNAYKVENDPANLRSVPKEEETGSGWRTVRDPSGAPIYEDMPLPVDMFDIQVALKPLADRYERTLSATDARASLGLKTMRDIINGPRHKPLSQAELDLGLLKEAARTEKGLRELRDVSQGMAANSVKVLQQKINGTMAGARGGAQGLAELQAGRNATAKKWGLYETARRFGKANIEELEPVAVAHKLLSGEDLQASFLRKIQAIAPAQMPKVGRAYLEGLLDRATREGDIGHMQQVLNQWDKLGKDAKRAFFGAAAGDFDKLFVSLKRLAAEPNPSGSGYIISLNRFKQTLTSALGAAVGGFGHGTGGAAIGVMGAQGLYVIENAALARLLYSPKFTRLLTRGIQLQLSGNKIGAASIAAQLIRLAGTDAQPAPFNEKPRPPLSSFHSKGN